MSEGGPAIACIELEPADCAGYADQIIALAVPARGAPFAIQIRPDSAVVEFVDGGEPVRVTLTSPNDPPILDGSSSWLGPYEPQSPRVLGPGPFPFELGHCGLLHQVDFDGSFWLPIGSFDGDAPALIGEDRGQIQLVGPNLARYTGGGGFEAALVRFPGPKHLFGCR